MCSERTLQAGSKRGTLIVVSGFSGAGKGALMKKLLAAYPDEYVLSVSVTTRSPRDKEVDGVDYYFKTQEEFDRLAAEGYFIEYAGYTDNSYGTPKPFVEENLGIKMDLGPIRCRHSGQNAQCLGKRCPFSGRR